jgi:putative ABC transport system substrate-binding protein
MLPWIRRVLLLYDPRDASPRREAIAAREAASQLGLTLVARETRSQEDLTRGLEALAEVEALLMVPGGLPTGQYVEIIRAAHAKRVATMVHTRTGSTMAALVSYGASEVDMARQLARHVVKILSGMKAGELPIERPMTLELVVNLKTAQDLGVTLSPEVLFRANRVLQ